MRTPLVCLLAVSTIPAAGASDPGFVDERHAYVRGEQASLTLKTAGGEEVAFSVSGWQPRRVLIRDAEARYELDTSSLHAGDYEVRAQPLRAGRDVGAAVIFPISIAPERDPQRFPVWNWSGGDDPDLAWWTARGFNGLRLSSVRDPLRGDRRGGTARALDEGTRLGVDIGAYFYPLLSSQWGGEASARCLLIDGTRDPRRVYPRDPGVLEYGRRTAASWVERYAGFPSFRHALLNSEYQVPFSKNDEARAPAGREAGLDLDEVLRTGWARKQNSSFDVEKLPAELRPREGLIPDDHPIYRFLKWWWERGHGTSVLNAEMARAIKAARPDVLTWHDPFRLAPVYHSDAGLDAISSWTYGHPDIKRLAYMRVLQAAARRDGQKVMQTITLYLYARYVMPMGRTTAQPLADRAGRDPSFVAGPDYAREAIWLVLSQRPDLIGFYYPGSSRPYDPGRDPYVTSPETFDAIGEVCRPLVEPYAPTVLRCRCRRPRVAVLNSAASVWFPGSPPWYSYPNEQILPYCSLLLMNHVPFDVVFDDDVSEGRLDHSDVLVVPRGDTLTRRMHERIVAFAGKKRVIANATMRADVPGAARTDFDFSFEGRVDGNALAGGRGMTAEEHRSLMESHADRLKPLVSVVRGPATCESKRVLINTLESHDLRYVFLVNDERAYGPRFGSWKLQFETGLRQTARVRLVVERETALYDAIEKKPIDAPVKDGVAEFDVILPAARGKVVAVLPERVGRVEIATPRGCERGR